MQRLVEAAACFFSAWPAIRKTQRKTVTEFRIKVGMHQAQRILSMWPPYSHTWSCMQRLELGDNSWRTIVRIKISDEIADDSRILNIHRILVSIHLWSVSVYLPWTSCSGCKEPTCKSHVCALTKIGIEFPDVSCRLWIRGFVLLAAFDKATFPGNWRTMRRPHLFLTAIMQKK